MMKTMLQSGEQAMYPRTICMLGGSGFVGQFLAARFAVRGFDIKVLTRAGARHRAMKVNPQVRLIDADVYDQGVLQQEFSGCHGVVNLIGILNEPGHRGRGFKRAHVELAQTVLNACAAADVHRLLHMSALNAAFDGPSHYLRTKGEAVKKVLAAGGDLKVP